MLISSRGKHPICYNCKKKELGQPVKNPTMKKMFAIPEAFYQEHSFLRSIKLNYLRYGSLTPKQIDAFKKTVAELEVKPSASSA